MDRRLLNKYFRDQCSEKELEEVLDWFQTEEGQAFLEEDIDQQNQRFRKNSDMFIYPEIKSEKLFRRIQLDKKKGLKRSWWFGIRVASILLVAGIISFVLYWEGSISSPSPSQKSQLKTYVTEAGQQKVLSLSDDTKIRLNEKSTLMVQPGFQNDKRKVLLKGEAYFEVAHDSDHPFLVNAIGSTIEVLGTKFNVNADSVSGNVQVAVLKGKVALRKNGKDNEVGALLTRNHLGILRLPDSQITIEKTNVTNYLSWISNRLVFRGASLLEVSRQLENLYKINLRFDNDQLKSRNLTADFEKTDLRKVLTIISQTLDINFKKNKDTIVWMD